MQPTVYIMASHKNGTLYTGVTPNLARRVYEHRNCLIPGFTEKHRVTHLVWYEVHEHMHAAYAAEKRIKRWRRAWKITAIESQNPGWRDLWFDLIPT